MKAVSRILPQLALTLVLAAILSFLVPVLVDSHEYAIAVTNYSKDPTSDNAEVVAQKRAMNDRVALITHLKAGGILFLVINVGWFLVARRPANPK
jgi:hypothetical protein